MAKTIERWLLPELVFDGDQLRNGMALGITSGKVVSVTEAANAERETSQTLSGIVCPGFVDLQVNGAGGVLLNSDPTPKAMFAIAKAHRQFGTTAILPTVITDTAEVLEKAVDAAIAAYGQTGICGLHIEGPHISQERRGTHKAEFVRQFDPGTFAHVARLRDANVPVMITLAPEIVTPEDIARLAKLGAVVSIGHSQASGTCVRRALDAGARCFTHLFNAMSNMSGREPGVVGSAINSDAYVGIICDGIHVSDEMVGLAIRARATPDRTFLVSDSMPTVGGPEEFNLYGNMIRLDHNRLVNNEGSLAGAHTTLAEGAMRLVSNLGLSPMQALRMVISVPSRAMGLKLEGLVGRQISDVLSLGMDLSLKGYLSDIDINESA